jgi:hypothetical protein
VRTSLAAACAGLLLLTACRERPAPNIAAGRLTRADGEAVRALRALVPEECRAGEVFGRQPDGDGVLAVLGTGLTRGDVVLWNGQPLKTTFGHSRLLTAAVPARLLESPGRVDVTVEDALDRSRATLRGSFRVAP